MPELLEQLVQESLKESEKIIKQDILVVPGNNEESKLEDKDPYAEKMMEYITDIEINYEPQWEE